MEPLRYISPPATSALPCKRPNTLAYTEPLIGTRCGIPRTTTAWCDLTVYRRALRTERTCPV